ncbi:DUF4870 domain-containing protein [Flavobacterium sp. '19STA2R22 D10 B1']|uniref:DUF4870 domain-containing protein n=1 Tax=Flavobacterium aerium TaxID=3037261 RepID=UPI00278C39AE|nr:DUF4870 domain-containing protein [Flavobacterium sp. '19STA2R22 D10 B1']
METTNNKNLAAVLQLSLLTQYFIPFGNYIFPVIIWNMYKKDSELVNHHGKQALNFQLSLLIYTILLTLIALPILAFTILKNIDLYTIINGNDIEIDQMNLGNISGIVLVAVLAIMIFFFLKLAEFILIIYAAIKASNNEMYKYPLTINFIK